MSSLASAAQRTGLVARRQHEISYQSLLNRRAAAEINAAKHTESDVAVEDVVGVQVRDRYQYTTISTRTQVGCLGHSMPPHKPFAMPRTYLSSFLSFAWASETAEQLRKTNSDARGEGGENTHCRELRSVV